MSIQTITQTLFTLALAALLNSCGQKEESNTPLGTLEQFHRDASRGSGDIARYSPPALQEYVRLATKAKASTSIERVQELVLKASNVQTAEEVKTLWSGFALAEWIKSISSDKREELKNSLKEKKMSESALEDFTRQNFNPEEFTVSVTDGKRATVSYKDGRLLAEMIKIEDSWYIGSTEKPSPMLIFSMAAQRSFDKTYDAFVNRQGVSVQEMQDYFVQAVLEEIRAIEGTQK